MKCANCHALDQFLRNALQSKTQLTRTHTKTIVIQSGVESLKHLGLHD
jgi:hypothetical protein